VIIKHVNEHVLVKDIQSLAYNIYLRKIVFNLGWILIWMFSFIEVGQKIRDHQDILFSLPVGYFDAADRSLIRKRYLEPGLKLIVLRVKVASVTLGGFPVEGEPWIIVLTLPVHAGGTGNAGDTGIS
jgi:hypothetical protein